MEASAKLIVLKLSCPLTQLPELARDVHSFKGVVRIPESVFVIRSELTAEALTARLARLIAGQGTVLVATIGLPCDIDGSDVALTQVRALLTAS